MSSHRLSANVDPIDDRWYETQDSRTAKWRLWKLYDPDANNKFRDPRSDEEAYWQNLIKRVLVRLRELKEEMSDPQFRPALRTIWYDLVAAGLIDNNQNRYAKLDERITEARHLGIIPPDAFSDETRPDLDEPSDMDPQEYASEVAHQLMVSAPNGYKPPRWTGQKYHVVFLCEKLAQADMVKHILQDKQVTLMIARGHNSYTRNYELYVRLKEIQDETSKKIILLYLGDWDPAGDVMDETIVDYLDRFGRRYGKLDYYFERIAVLAKHETVFGVTLPSKPDARVYELDSRGYPKDKNAARFKARYGVIKQIELDVLTSRQLLPHFKKLLRDAVDKYWDREIWEQHKDELSKACAIEEINKRVKLTDFGQKEIDLYAKLAEAVRKGDNETRNAAAIELVKMNKKEEKEKKKMGTNLFKRC